MTNERKEKLKGQFIGYLREAHGHDDSMGTEDFDNDVADYWLSVLDQEITTAVTKAVLQERERVVGLIEERERIKAQMVYKSYDEPIANSAYLKACGDIKSLITNESGINNK